MISTLDPNDRQYSEQMSTKKRKYAEAFPSDQLDPTEGNSSRKKRLLNEVKEQSLNVFEY